MIEASNAVVAVVTFYAQELAKLAAMVEQLKTANAAQAAKIAERSAVIEKQAARIAELAEELGSRD